MEMEEKESTESGSLEETESSPPPPPAASSIGGGGGVVPEAMNMAVNMSMERSIGVAATGGGAGGVVGAGVTGSGSGDLGVMGGVKKKRGRPRKYDSGNFRPQSMTAAGGGGATQPGFTLTSPHSSEYPSSSKRGRGRPPGSGNWQVLASLGELFANTAGGDFTPHVVTVQSGEDVAGKILSFAQMGPRGICILAANGSISNVTIRQPGSTGGLLTYEGRFEILSLTGSYTVSENSGIKSRNGGLSVSLAGPDGRVIGGGVAGLLIASSPIQIVFGSFTPNGYKTHKRKHNPEPRMSTVIQGAPDPVSVAAPHSVSVARPVPLAAQQSINHPTPTLQMPVQSQGEVENGTSNKHNLNSPSIDIAGWNGSAPTTDQKRSPDINLSVPFEQQ